MAEPVLIADFYASGSWHDLGAPRSVKIKRGRDKAQDKTSAGSMVLTFGNADRSYDPEYNAGLYGMPPGTKIRLRATWNAITYPLFYGYLDRLIQYFGNSHTPHDAIAVFDVVDGLALLANIGIPSPYEVAMRGHAPRAWYRFAESGGTIAENQVDSALYGTYVGSPTFGETSTVDSANDTAVKFTAPGAAYMVAQGGTFPTGANWSLLLVLKIPSTLPTADDSLLYQGTGAVGLQIVYRTTGKIWAIVRNGASVITSQVTSTSAYNGSTIMLLLVAEAGQLLKMYDGDFAISSLQSGTTHTLPNNFAILGVSYYHSPTFDEFITFDYALNGTQRTNLRLAMTGYAPDTILDRTNWILDAAGWEAGLRAITTAAPGVLYYPEPGPALTLLQEIETTIEGRLWIKPDGVLVLLYYTALLAAPYTTVEATFADDGTANPYVGIGPYSTSWELLSNVVQRINSNVVATNVTKVRDATSIATYGVRDQSEVATVISKYRYLTYELALATYRLGLYKNPIKHVDGLDVYPAKNPTTLFPVVLGLDISDRIELKRKPQGVGAFIDIQALIEGRAV